MIDPTAHIDPHWPHDAEDAAREQPSLLDVGPVIVTKAMVSEAFDAMRALPGTGETVTLDTLTRKPRSDKGKPRDVLTLSPSETNTLQTCARMYWYSYEQGRRPALADDAAREWGLWVHRSLAQAYRAIRRGLSLDVGIALALRQIDRTGTEGKGRIYTPPASPHARAMLRAVVRTYLVTWGPGDVANTRVLAVEKRYDLPALRADNGSKLVLRQDGVIDLVLASRTSGAVDILDHKTTASDFEREEYWIGADLDPQALSYWDVAGRLGWPPARFLWDMIKKPGLAKTERPLPQESPDAFEARMISIILGNPRRYFMRKPISYQPWQIARHREQTIQLAEEIRWRRRTGAWPMNRGSCKSFGGCDWIRVCTGEHDLTDDTLYPLKSKE